MEPITITLKPDVLLTACLAFGLGLFTGAALVITQLRKAGYRLRHTRAGQPLLEPITFKKE